MSSAEAPTRSSELHAERIYLVRHGETERSANHVYSGQADVPLTAGGREQAKLAGARLAGAGVDAIYSSPLSRAADTAAAIADATGAALTIDERLIEVDHGPLEGLDRDGARERFGERFEDYRADPFGSPLAGMERLDDALERAYALLSDALAASRCPVLVAHQAILRVVLVALGRVEPDGYFSIRLSEAEPVEITAPSLARVRE